MYTPQLSPKHEARYIHRRRAPRPLPLVGSAARAHFPASACSPLFPAPERPGARMHPIFDWCLQIGPHTRNESGSRSRSAAALPSDSLKMAQRGMKLRALMARSDSRLGRLVSSGSLQAHRAYIVLGEHDQGSRARHTARVESGTTIRTTRSRMMTKDGRGLPRVPLMPLPARPESFGQLPLSGIGLIVAGLRPLACRRRSHRRRHRMDLRRRRHAEAGPSLVWYRVACADKTANFERVPELVRNGLLAP